MLVFAKFFLSDMHQVCSQMQPTMKSRIIRFSAKGFILLSALCLVSVSLQAFYDPQDVMNLVKVNLPNTDAASSIRGVYGGVGMALCISLVYLMISDVSKGLAFLILLWGFYALSRTITIFSEGALGDFGRLWLCIETSFFFIALALFVAYRRLPAKSAVRPA